MMEAAPAAGLIVPKPDLLLELLIVPLDAPAHLGEIDKSAEADVRRQCREPIFGRFGFALGPFDQQPFLLQRGRVQPIMPDADAHACKAVGQPISRAFPPSARAPGPLRQATHHLLGRDQVGLVTTARVVQRLALSPRAGSRCTPTRIWQYAR